MSVRRLISILVLFLLRYFNWIERYNTMKIGRFFLFEHIWRSSDSSQDGCQIQISLKNDCLEVRDIHTGKCIRRFAGTFVFTRIAGTS